MKIYTVEKVNLGKLYLLIVIGVLIYCLLIILLIRLITLFFPDFNNVGLLFVLTALVFGSYIYKFSYSKSSKKIQIKLNDNKMVIEENEILLENLKRIKFRGARFNCYPKLIIELVNTKKINFRMTKNNDFDKLIIGLKTNLKTNPVFNI